MRKFDSSRRKVNMESEVEWTGPADLDLRPRWVGKADVAQVQIGTLRATAGDLLTTGLHLHHAVQELENSL